MSFGDIFPGFNFVVNCIGCSLLLTKPATILWRDNIYKCTHLFVNARTVIHKISYSWLVSWHLNKCGLNCTDRCMFLNKSCYVIMWKLNIINCYRLLTDSRLEIGNVFWYWSLSGDTFFLTWSNNVTNLTVYAFVNPVLVIVPIHFNNTFVLICVYRISLFSDL